MIDLYDDERAPGIRKSQWSAYAALRDDFRLTAGRPADSLPHVVSSLA